MNTSEGRSHHPEELSNARSSPGAALILVFWAQTWRPCAITALFIIKARAMKLKVCQVQMLESSEVAWKPRSIREENLAYFES